MMRRHLPALVLLLAANGIHAQTLLHEWDFAGGIGEWVTAHSTQALAHEEGAMVIRVSGPDPYIHCSKGHCLDIPGNERQFIRIRLRSDTEAGASFYWADTTQGPDAGFVAEQVVGFRVTGDDEWHEIDVYPGWRGQITRLRLDPPGNEEGPVTRVARIAIYEWPESPQTGEVRDLTIDHGNWLPRGGTVAQKTADGLRVEGEQPVVATRVDHDPGADPWLTVEGEADRDGLLIVSWTDPEGERRTFSHGFTPERARHVIRFADGGGPVAREEEVRLRFAFTQPPGAFVLRRIALAGKPMGGPMLDVLGARLDRAATFVGEPATLELELQNSGGEPLGAGTVPASKNVAAAIEHPALQPGERAALRVGLGEMQPGTHVISVGLRGAEKMAALAVSARPNDDVPPGAAVRPGTASLAGESVRLRAGSAGDDRYGPLWLEVSDGARWRAVAELPAIGVVMPGPEERHTIDSAPANARGKQLVFSDSFDDEEGRRWTASAAYRLAAPDRIAVEHRLTCDGDAELYHFSGPWLRVGDGSSGADRLEAIFPGLEYLGADVAEQEASSSDRDIAPPRDLRIVPDRHKITIPLQAVTLPNHDLVALLWNNEPDGTGPAAIFASPNSVEGGDPRVPGFALRSGANHLMGLFLPAVPEHVPENAIAAETPLPMAKGKPVVLRSQILARPKGEVLDAVATWIDVYRPKPAGKVADLMPQTLRLSGDFYLNEYGQKQQDSAAIAVQCLHLSHLLPDPELRDLAAVAPGRARDLALALHAGNVPDALWAATLAGRERLDQRSDDGSWVFEPDERRSVLGPRGETNSGIIALPLITVLRSARATADEEMLAEGLEAIEHLRQFRVPRGAQVWEVPLHCPDILASGRACEAFTIAYELTGDEAYLRDAQYWAATARPFIYHWQHPRPDLAPMRGGSIPVFGGSFFTNAWFGRLVQWNGMAVARALHGLARAGGGEEWADLAEDLVVSGQRQQITDPENKDYGRYPDYWNMRTGIPGYWLSPGLLLTSVLERAGYTPDGDWLIMRSGGKLVTIASPTPLKQPRAGKEALGPVATEVDAALDLSFTVDYPLGPPSYVAVIGVGRPSLVKIAGREVSEEANLDGAASGWQHSPDFAALVLKLDHAAGRRVPVAITGLAATDAPDIAGRRAWEFREAAHGWGASAHDLGIERRDGNLVLTAIGGDPYFSGPRMALPSDEIERIVIRARVTQAGTFQIFWPNDGGGYGPEWSATTSPIPADGAFHDASVTLSGHAEWKGTLRRLRLDPPGGVGSVTEIESIRLEP